jgi:hypothetical protein
MVREDLFFAVVTFMTMWVLAREIVALIHHRHDRDGARPA